MTTLAVIPARGGSKGIPRKNMRLMAGKPLIAYSIENALASDAIDAVVVSSDSEEILAFAAQYEGVMALNRQTELAGDAVTLDPVICDAVMRWEAATKDRCDVVVTLQPTSPLLSSTTLDAALRKFAVGDDDTLISVVNSPHLSWKKGRDGNPVPSYDKRLNRQQLPPRYLETGAFFISKRRCVTEESRIGPKVGVFEVPEEEATDIDRREDWIVCESLIRRKKIVFRVDGYRELGLGHVYRALTLAYELTEHDVVFVCDSSCREGIEKLRTSHMQVVEVSSDEELVCWTAEARPDIFVNDRLDTSIEYVSALRPYVGRFVTFEDLGPGSRDADAVVNALYEDGMARGNVFAGRRYVCLRDEFLTSRPAPFSDEVRHVLVMFGGTDPLDLSARVFDIARQLNESHIAVKFTFILGSGYRGAVKESDGGRGIEVCRDVVRVSDYMRRADMAVSSQGRTTYELASMGVPTIVLAQNDRERMHTFAQMDNGFINLGHGREVADEDIASTICWLIGAPSIRREMRRLMLENDLRSGIERVKRIILGELL